MCASQTQGRMCVAKPQTRFARRYSSVPVRPCAVAGTRWDAVVAWSCVAVLGAILLVELLTPNDVVASLAILPLLAAMWALSAGLAVRITFLAAIVFALILATEAGNRPTVFFIATVAAVVAACVRFYAVSIATLWPATRQPIVALNTANGIDSLTPRELEVATLASHGYTAAEVGALLHISDRTVESHLANAYAKLAIHSRSGLRELGDLVR
jgi:DNA-binding CsgD family transcriptional regulator